MFNPHPHPFFPGFFLHKTWLEEDKNVTRKQITYVHKNVNDFEVLDWIIKIM